MLSAKVIENAQQAEHYFSQDNYYTTEEGFEQSAWAGMRPLTVITRRLSSGSRRARSKGSGLPPRC